MFLVFLTFFLKDMMQIFGSENRNLGKNMSCASVKLEDLKTTRLVASGL